MENTPKKYNLEERLIGFAVMVLDLADQLPNTFAGKHLGGQITRSGTSPALNYGEAQAAESNNDFYHKLCICLKELRETQICLKIIDLKIMVKKEQSSAVVKEANELVAIFTKSVASAKLRKTK